ncbi:MAG: hypothetical protein AABX09_03795 [Thermoproteota archaeon]
MVKTSTLAVILAALIISVVFTGEADGAGLVKRAISTVGTWTEAEIPQLGATKIADGTVTNSEFQFINSLTSNAQTQIDAKGVGDMTLAGVQTVTGAKTFGTAGGAVGKLILAGSGSGSTILDAGATASGTATLPQAGGNLTTLARISGNSGAAGSDITFQKLTATSVQSSTTPGVVMTTTGVGVGTWHFKYVMTFQSAATTTGIKVAVNHSGTLTSYVMQSQFVSTGAAAATGVGDQVTSSATAGIHEGHGERVKNTATVATVGVDTVNADMLIIVEGTAVVSASGNLTLLVGSEVAASAITVQTGTYLELHKIA